MAIFNLMAIMGTGLSYGPLSLNNVDIFQHEFASRSFILKWGLIVGGGKEEEGRVAGVPAGVPCDPN